MKTVGQAIPFENRSSNTLDRLGGDRCQLTVRLFITKSMNSNRSKVQKVKLIDQEFKNSTLYHNSYLINSPPPSKEKKIVSEHKSNPEDM